MSHTVAALPNCAKEAPSVHEEALEIGKFNINRNLLTTDEKRCEHLLSYDRAMASYAVKCIQRSGSIRPRHYAAIPKHLFAIIRVQAALTGNP